MDTFTHSLFLCCMDPECTLSNGLRGVRLRPGRVPHYPCMVPPSGSDRLFWKNHWRFLESAQEHFSSLILLLCQWDSGGLEGRDSDSLWISQWSRYPLRDTASWICEQIHRQPWLLVYEMETQSAPHYLFTYFQTRYRSYHEQFQLLFPECHLHEDSQVFSHQKP